ncbi:OLC1v1021131C1 [Oldenlandia corymbosa var. corymbosa]|uniref:serine O-acetyltransferase n=1 Tax=Oldenlandia corymbosa var. corymbosa TaxID=529605 RepID=A0AAV1BYM8_OLDCO|nr:OLC1v1021131C1 [Oldenlandia corymbosa var. corymbosa]
MVPCIDDSRINDRNGVDSCINNPLSNLITSSNTTQALMTLHEKNHPSPRDMDPIWLKIHQEASLGEKQEPILSTFFRSTILSFDSLESALANLLAVKLCNPYLSRETLYGEFLLALQETDEILQGNIREAIRADLRAWRERDPACLSYLHCFLDFKGFQACQAYRISHTLWLLGRRGLALIIQARVSEVFGVDIHPRAKIGKGIVIDHATGVVIGETCVVGDNVTIFHNVTLGGRGEEIWAGGEFQRTGFIVWQAPNPHELLGGNQYDEVFSGEQRRRHPEIGDGVLIGAGAKVLGNIRVGNGARIGAASLVLKDVPPLATAVGNPARLVHHKRKKIPP